MGDHRINNAPLIRFRVYNISIMLTESEGGLVKGLGSGGRRLDGRGTLPPSLGVYVRWNHM